MQNLKSVWRFVDAVGMVREKEDNRRKIRGREWTVLIEDYCVQIKFHKAPQLPINCISMNCIY